MNNVSVFQSTYATMKQFYNKFTTNENTQQESQSRLFNAASSNLTGKMPAEESKENLANPTLKEIGIMAKEVNDLEPADISKYMEKNGLNRDTVDTVMTAVSDKHNSQVDKYEQIDLKEVLFAIKMCLIAQHFPLLLPKSDTELTHSILLYKENNNYCILIKPNVQIKNKSSLNELEAKNLVASGASKIVKTTGFEIRLNADDDTLSPLEMQRVVTVSRSPADKTKKGEGLNQHLENLHSDNFRKIDFSVTQNGRVQLRTLFVKKYLGKDLLSLLAKHKEFTVKDRIEVIDQLCKKITKSTYDIKLENTLWDGSEVHLIDDKEKITTFAPRYNGKGPGSNSDEIMMERIQMFSFILMGYQMFTPSGEDIEGMRYIDIDKKPTTLDLDPYNPFSQLLQDAYSEEVIDNLDECKEKILNILYYKLCKFYV